MVSRRVLTTNHGSDISEEMVVSAFSRLQGSKNVVRAYIKAQRKLEGTEDKRLHVSLNAWAFRMEQ